MARAIPYQRAIQWIVEYDDTDWVNDNDETCVITASLVADIYGKSDDQVRLDLRAALAKLDAA